MNILKVAALALLTGLVAMTPIASPMAASTVVHVSLWDKGAESMSMLGKGPMMGMGMMDADRSNATMGVTIDSVTVPAGDVTFEAVNNSKILIHEMVISPVVNPDQPLPYNNSELKVDEDAAGHLGEVAELEPGASGALRLTLKPGTYILYCNIAGHYSLGMWALLKVGT